MRRRPRAARLRSQRRRSRGRARRRAGSVPRRRPHDSSGPGRPRPTAGRAGVRPPRRRGRRSPRGPAPFPPRRCEPGRGRASLAPASPTQTATESVSSGTGSTRVVARGLAGSRTNPSRSAPASAATRDVLLPRQPADLDERARDELREFRGGIRRAHEGRPDEDRIGARELGSGALRPRLDAGLRDDDAVSRDRGRGARAVPHGRSRTSRGHGR